VLHFSARRDTFFDDAVLSGNLAAVRGYLQEAPGWLDALSWTNLVAALHVAAANDYTAIVAFLLEKGAAVDVVGGRGRIAGPGAQKPRSRSGCLRRPRCC
jgi:ankyrin repeat protein